MVGRPKKERTLSKYWIFLDIDEAKKIRVRAEEFGISFSAYVRKLIQRDLKSDSWKK